MGARSTRPVPQRSGRRRQWPDGRERPSALFSLTNHLKEIYMQTAIPRSLKEEHDALHEELVRATKQPGATGEAARQVARVLHSHFVAEEEYALPPLGLLAAVARGETPANAGQALAMAERLRTELPRMLGEHRAIVEALDVLIEAAKRENHSEVTRFAVNLKLHAQTEEEVLYPATLVLGEVLRHRGVKA